MTQSLFQYLDDFQRNYHKKTGEHDTAHGVKSAPGTGVQVSIKQCDHQKSNRVHDKIDRNIFLSHECHHGVQHTESDCKSNN